MTERQGEHSDDQASPPPRPPEFPERFANPSGPGPGRPESDPPAPPSAENDSWGDPPPGLGGGALLGDAPSPDSLTFEKLFNWSAQPSSQHLGAPDERAVVFDPSTASVPDSVAGRGDTPLPGPPIGPQDSGGPGERAARATLPPPNRFDQHEQRPPGERPLRPEPFPPRTGPPWQPPPPPPQQPPGEWPANGQGFNYAEGSAANWNYVDSIRSSELVPTRRIPPGRGWRKLLYIASFNLVNLGQSPDERYQGELETKIRSLLRGTYKIGVLGKGGVGKSTISASVGSVFAELRQNDRVVAIDADTGFGKLATSHRPGGVGLLLGVGRRQRAVHVQRYPEPGRQQQVRSVRAAGGGGHRAAAHPERRHLPQSHHQARPAFHVVGRRLHIHPGFAGDPRGARRCRWVDRGVLTVV